MKKIIYFSINSLIASSHPDLYYTENFIGQAIATDNGEDLEIDVQQLYVCADPMANVTPLAYTAIDPLNVEFQKGDVKRTIESDVCNRYDTDKNDDFAETVCEYYQARKRMERNGQNPIKVTIHEQV